jgi:hypothetical protein
MIFSANGPRVRLSWLAFVSRAGIAMIQAAEPYPASLPQTALFSLPSVWRPTVHVIPYFVPQLRLAIHGVAFREGCWIGRA